MCKLLDTSDCRMVYSSQTSNFEFFENDVKKNDRCFGNSLLKTKLDTKAGSKNQMKSLNFQLDEDLIKSYELKERLLWNELFINWMRQLNSDSDRCSENPLSKMKIRLRLMKHPLLKMETDIQLESNRYPLEINHTKPP